MATSNTFAHIAALYAIEHEGKAFTPDGVAKIDDVEAHNKAQEAMELARWAEKPDCWAVYIARREDSTGKWFEAQTWLGTRLNAGSVLTSTFRGNIARNMRTVRFVGTNGATYYGRYGSDWAQLCRVRKAKV